MKNIFKYIIIILLITIIILIGTIFYLKIKDDKIVFRLIGNSEITMYENEIYNELGFLAVDDKNNRLNEKVLIESNLDNTKVGDYTITYKLKGNIKTYILERKITVLEDPFKKIVFELKGNKVNNISLNEEFIDPLYTCINNKNNTDLSNTVKIENNVNNKQVGTYEIKYILVYENKEKVLTRTVNVLEKVYDAILSTNEPTNQDITINFVSNINNFSYIIAPDEKLIYEKTTSYVVNENGNYKFTVYDDENSFKEYEIKITNIDKIAPVISSCNSIIKNNTTTYTITSNDTDINKYIVNNDNNLIGKQNQFTINSVVENGQITVYDNANNSSTIKCNSYYQEIIPKGTENIKYNVSSDTLKIWLELVDRKNRTDFYVTHIWALDAYNQFKAQVPNKFGGELLRSKDLLENAVKDQNLSNKIAVAVNGSGFIKNGTWGQKYYDANKKYNLTSGSPIVIVNGKVLRDLTNSNLPTGMYHTYGIKKDGNLAYYYFPGGNRINENQAVSKQIINDGVLNTVAFNPVLVVDGKVKSTDTAKNIRQAFCQIDKNNFIFITDIYNSARNGFSHKEMGEYMVTLGCKTGVNLDGGGSTSLIFKDKNSNPLVITGNNRSIADIVYFHE